MCLNYKPVCAECDLFSSLEVKSSSQRCLKMVISQTDAAEAKTRLIYLEYTESTAANVKR